MGKQKAIDAVLALLPTLTEKEKTKVRKALNMKEQEPCEKLGHKFRTIKQVKENWISVDVKYTMICERCGAQQEI